MMVVAALVASVLGLLGLVFVVGSQGEALRIVVGAVLMAAAGAVIWLARQRPRVEEKRVTVVQKIDLSGDVQAEVLECRQCGGELDKSSVSVRAGAVFVECGYCGSSYQIEEAPKW